MWTLQVPEVADIVLILFDDPNPALVRFGESAPFGENLLRKEAAEKSKTSTQK